MSSPWKELLPTSVEVGGAEYEIRSDYRAILDICGALSDPEFTGQDKAVAALDIFYASPEEIPPELYQEALDRCFWFIDGGELSKPQKSPRLVDWEQDFRYIIAPINRVAGQEIRSVEYMHWWTFLALYMEIGDCVFAQIVRIRDKLARRKPLDKQERLWYRQNRQLVDFKRKYTDDDQALFREWSGA